AGQANCRHGRPHFGVTQVAPRFHAVHCTDLPTAWAIVTPSFRQPFRAILGGLMPDLITSLQNPRVKQVVRLRDRRHRDEQGLLLVEGVSELALALAGGAHPQTVYFCPAFGTDSSQLLAKAIE